MAARTAGITYKTRLGGDGFWGAGTQNDQCRQN